MPGISMEVIAVALLAALAVLALLNSHRIEALIMSIAGRGHRPGGLDDLSGLPLIPRLYWSAVRLVEIITGVRMEASITHREYLSLVSPKLGGLAEPLESLTESYELYRFAGLRDRDIEEEALKSYGELLEHGGSERS